MNTRGNLSEVNWNVYFKKLILGGFANFISTFLTLPFFFATVQKQAKGERSYLDIAKYAATPEGLKKFVETSKDVAKFAPKQSLAYLGIYNLLYESFKSLGPVQCGLILGSITGFTESLATSKDMQAMIKKLSSKTANFTAMDEMTIKRRALMALLVKNGVGNPATIVSILCAREYLEKIENGSSSSLVMWAALVGGAFANLTVIPPVNTLLTRVNSFPDKGFYAHFKDIIATESVYVLWRGAIARSVQKSLQAAIGFGMMDKGNKLIGSYVEDNVEAAKKPSDFVGSRFGRFFSASCNQFDQVEEDKFVHFMRIKGRGAEE